MTLRIAAALICVSLGQAALWLILPAGATRSPLWAAAALAAALVLVTIEVRRRRASQLRTWGTSP